MWINDVTDLFARRDLNGKTILIITVAVCMSCCISEQELIILEQNICIIQ